MMAVRFCAVRWCRPVWIYRSRPAWRIQTFCHAAGPALYCRAKTQVHWTETPRRTSVKRERIDKNSSRIAAGRLLASVFIRTGLCLFLFAAGAIAQTAPVRYVVELDKQPASHILNISVQAESAGSDWVDFAMPAWSPGAYFVHNAWRNVQEFAASDETGAVLGFEKVDKQTWR